MAKRLLFSLVSTAVAVSAFILITCTLPSNPYDDPTNFDMKITAKDTSTIYTGKKAVIRLDINIPQMLKSLKVDFGEGTKDTAFEYTNQSFTDSDVIYLTCVYDTAGQKSVTALAYLTNGATKQFYGTITVVAASIPPDNQSNFAITVFSKENKTIIEGKPAEIGLAVNLPKYLKNIKVSFGETGIKDTTISYTKQNMTSPDTLYVPCTYNTNGKKTVTINVTLTGDLQKSFDVSLNVAAREFSIVFDTIPVTDTIAVNALDSLRFIAHTEPGDSLISYSVTSFPVIKDTTQLKLKIKVLNKTTGSAAVVYITPSDTGKYTITLKAQSGGVIDSQKVVVYALKAPEFSKKPADSTGLTIGKSDTLVFAVNKEPNDTVRFVLKNQSDFKAGTVVVLSSQADTLKIVFTPDEAKKYCFIVAATGKHLSNSIRVIRNVLSDVSSFWKQSTIIVNAVEGTLLQTDLKANFNDTTASGVTYAIDKGEMSGNTLKYTAPYGKTADTFGITANQTGKSPAQLEVIVQITSGDSSKPSVARKTPSSDDYKSSASQVTCEYTITDEGAGVGSVVFSIGDSVLTDTTHTGNVYGCTIKKLVKGQKTTVSVVAKDASIKKNSASASVNITYDPTMDDNVAPVISLKNPKINEERVETDTITIQIACKDDNGIASVTAVRANKTIDVTNSSDSIYSVKLTSLTAGKSDTVVFTAMDKSANANIKTFSAIVKYDRKLSNITLLLPENNATGVALKPTCSWSGGNTPDGTAVTYTLKYGTSEANLSKSLTGLTTASATITSNLTPNTSYYWQVVSKSNDNNDTTVSDVWTFTTVEAAPVISKDPSDTSVLVGNKATFSVTASGLNLKYQWQKGTTDTTGATSSSYTTAVTTSSDDASTYRCIVSNNGGADTSAAAKLTIQYSVMYNGNGKESGSVPVDANAYSKNETVTTKANTDLAKTGYELTGWNTAKDGSGTTYAVGTGSFTMNSASVILYAKWVHVYTVTFNDQEATKSVDPPTKSVTDSEAIGTLPTSPEKTGYVFSGWWTVQNGGGTEITADTIVTSNRTVYAKWEIRDVDGNLYHEVKIGNQVWMVENLKTTKLSDGTAIDTTYIKFPNNDKKNKDKFGLLYISYYIVTQNAYNIAPSGWCIPSKAAFDTLKAYLISHGYGYNGVDTAIAKSLAATSDWHSTDTMGTPGNSYPPPNNNSGFSALPSGTYSGANFGTVCEFFTTTPGNVNSRPAIIYYELTNSRSTFNSYLSSQFPGLSIRCVRAY